jgi:2-polyprenyl-6-methoxyphenol hydroxylase-like FAD-dependent oxidoreductase
VASAAAPSEVPVLIVGGSLVGLSAAVCLGRHGVPAFLVERHPGTAIHPRAAHFSQRTIEVFREAGIERDVMEAADREFVQNGAIMSVESLGGKELDWYFRNVNEGFEDLSPSKRLFITQIGLEPILRRRAAELGALLNYGWELTSLDAHDGENEAVLVERESGEEHRVRARWVVAADGPRSGVREHLGVPMEGRGGFSNSVTIYFRADVRPMLGDRNLSVVYVFHPRLVGFFRFSKAGDAGFLVVNRLVGEDGVRTTDVSALADEEQCVEWVRLALGAPDLPVEIENVQNWVALADSAAEYRRGNVFIAGDAAHTMPPTGGFGGNTGVQDAHNLAWKLAAVLRGSAGEALLDTYDRERRPVGKAITEQAYTRYVLRLDPELGTDDVEPMIHDAPIELGYRYDSDTVFEDPHDPSGDPGTRAPHVWVQDGRSTLDLFGDRFALLAAGAVEVWRQAADAAAGDHGIEMDSHEVSADGFAARYGLGEDGATLVRPDGFIAWRAESAPDDPAGELSSAVRAALGS